MRDCHEKGAGLWDQEPITPLPPPLLFVYNLVIRYSEKKQKLCEKNAFNKKKKKPRLEFNPGLALIGFRTAGLYLRQK